MPNELTREQLQRLARLGARARLDEIEAERQSILRAFPGLAGVRTGEPAEGEDAPADGPKARRRRRKMPAAQRKAQSDRMKKYWAERKKAQS